MTILRVPYHLDEYLPDLDVPLGRPRPSPPSCTTALGTVAGLQRAGLDPGIVWFDARGDVQTLETTASGYLDAVSR